MAPGLWGAVLGSFGLSRQQFESSTQMGGSQDSSAAAISSSSPPPDPSPGQNATILPASAVTGLPGLKAVQGQTASLPMPAPSLPAMAPAPGQDVAGTATSSQSSQSPTGRRRAILQLPLVSAQANAPGVTRQRALSSTPSQVIHSIETENRSSDKCLTVWTGPRCQCGCAKGI